MWQTKFLYWAILGCQSDQIAAASWSGNSDNQLSLNLSPNIRILFVMWVEKIVKTCNSGLGFRETMF